MKSKNKPSKRTIRLVLNEVETLGLPDGAHWVMVHERLGLEYGEVFPLMSADPEYFDLVEK